MSLRTPELALPGPPHPAALPRPESPGIPPAVRASPVHTGDPAMPAELTAEPRLLSRFHCHLLRPPAPWRGSKTPHGQAHAGWLPTRPPDSLPRTELRASSWGRPRARCHGMGLQPGLVTAGSPQDPGGPPPSESLTPVWLGLAAPQTCRSRRHPRAREVQGGGRHGAQGWRRPPPAPRRAPRHRAGAEGLVPHLLRLQWQVPKPCADVEARGPWGGPGRGGRGRGTAVQPGPSAGGTITSSSRTPTLLAPRCVSGV